MLIYFGMNLTFREEITILSMIFVFSALTIPIVIVTSNEYQAKPSGDKVDVTPMRIPPISTYRDKVLVNSVRIIEEFNQNHTNASDQITFAKLLGMKPYELRERYLTLTHTTTKTNVKTAQKNVDVIWRHFAFHNGTILTSKSTAIPLTVDW